jgi:hypothetical protein
MKCMVKTVFSKITLTIFGNSELEKGRGRCGSLESEQNRHKFSVQRRSLGNKQDEDASCWC